MYTATVVSVLVLIVALYIILFRPEDRKGRDWAFAVIGLILGYWFKVK